MLQIQRARDAPREHTIDLRRRELRRDLVENLDELPAGGDVVLRAGELLFTTKQRVVHRANVRAGAQLRADARHHIRRSQRLGEPAVGAIAKHRRSHVARAGDDHRHFLPIFLAADLLQGFLN